MIPSAPRPAANLHTHVLDRLGRGISDGTLGAGSVLFIEELAGQFGVSRPVVREALRVLAAKGMVTSKRRVGTTVTPHSGWRAFDPDLIRWRLASGAQADQLRMLIEVRTAFEPVAAAFASQRATAAERTELVELGDRLYAAGHGEDEATFVALDVEFHRSVLRLSGNAMFAELHDVVDQLVTGRHRHGLVPRAPDERALGWHVNLARAVRDGDSEGAAAAARKIVEQAMRESQAALVGPVA